MNLTTKQLLFINAILAMLTLPLTFIWLEIGPLGKQYYGLNVPDIYILGSTILGKDRSFSSINFAYKFQLLVIIYFTISAIWTIKILDIKKIALTLTSLNLLILVLFPFWLHIYTYGVINNSDGAAADIEIHFGFGLLVYIILLIVSIITFKRIKKASS